MQLAIALAVDDSVADAVDVTAASNFHIAGSLAVAVVAVAAVDIVAAVAAGRCY